MSDKGFSVGMDFHEVFGSEDQAVPSEKTTEEQEIVTSLVVASGRIMADEVPNSASRDTDKSKN